MNDGQPLLVVDFHRKRDHVFGSQARKRRLDSQFDVLRIVVAASDDDPIFQAASDIKLAMMEESQIASAQEGALAGIRQEAAKCVLCRFRLLEITQRDARPADPDLADPVPRTLMARRRIDDHYLLTPQSRSTAHQTPRRSKHIRHLEHTTFAQLGCIHIEHHRRITARPAGSHEGRFGQAVDRQECLLAETALREYLDKAIQGPCADRLGTGKGQTPTAQVQTRSLCLADLSNTDFVPEIRSATDRCTPRGDRLQPQQRPLQEGRWR